MNKIYEHLNLISSTSLIAMPFFEGKNQNELDRFVYVGIKKISKISLAFLRLYEQVDDSEDLEFSLGILSRSIMMDMILLMGIQKILIKYNENNYDEVKEEIKNYCLKIISDGTTHLIEQIHESEILSNQEKSDAAVRLASKFSDVFDFSTDTPKIKKEYRFKHSNIYKESKQLNIEDNKSIYHLYDFYSKYDHLSHWASEFDKIPIEIRKGKLDLSILYMGYHLKNLLAIAYDFADGYTSLLPLIQDIEKSENENFENDSSEIL
jgi:hypothetical protein